MVLADSAYATGDALAALKVAGHTPVIKNSFQNDLTSWRWQIRAQASWSRPRWMSARRS